MRDQRLPDIGLIRRRICHLGVSGAMSLGLKENMCFGPRLGLAGRRSWFASALLVEILQPLRSGGIPQIARAAIPGSRL